MVTAFLTVFEQMFRILLLICGGFALRKFRLLPEGAEKASKCIACGICVKACPMDVLEIVEQ